MSKIKKYPFAELYEMSSGISSKKEQAGHGAPFVSFSTVFNNYFLPEELPDLMDTSEKEQEIYSIKEGDILITRTSETIDELAMSCVATKDYPNATYSGFTKRLRPITEGIAYSKYIAFYLRGYLFRKSVTNNAFMTLRASFNEDIFSFLDLHLPEYEQQVRIGDLLYKIEQKIQLNKKINDNLEQQIKYLYNYWFLQYNFPNQHNMPYKSSGGKIIYNHQLKKGIPENWTVVTLNTLCDILSGYSFQSNDYVDNGKYRLITIKNVQDSGVNLNVDNYINILPTKLPDYCILKPENILMSLTGNVARVGLMYDNNCLLNQRVALIKPKKIQVNSFLYALFKSDAIRTTLEGLATGTSQKNLSPIDAGNINIPYSESVVNSFSNFIEDKIKLIVRNSCETLSLCELRDWLLPMLMNGQATIDN